MRRFLTVFLGVLLLSVTGLQSQVIISEIMQNPSAVGDSDGEWFEIYNAGASAVNINGWTISDNGADSHTIDNGGDLIVPAGGFLVLGRSDTQPDNGDLPVDYVYGTAIALANGDDELVLTDGSAVEQDRVEYDGGPNWPDPTGSSMVFTGSPSDDNNDYNFWSTSSSREGNYVGGTGDNGSPGTNGSDQSLPVELSSFSAKGLDNQVKLSWTTQSEIDNVGFVVLRSNVEEGSYVEVSSYTHNVDLQGHGNSSEIHHYNFVDNSVVNELTYYYKLRDISVSGAIGEHGPVNATPHAQVEETPVPLVTEFKLNSAYPNPFNPSTNLSFSIPAKDGELLQVTLDIYNLAGVKICNLINEKMGATENFEKSWNAVDDNGQAVTNGIYFAVLKAGPYKMAQKLVLLK